MQFLVIIYFKYSSHSRRFSSLLFLRFLFSFTSFSLLLHLRYFARSTDKHTVRQHPVMMIRERRREKRHWNVGEIHSSAQFMTRPSLCRSAVSRQSPNIRH